MAPSDPSIGSEKIISAPYRRSSFCLSTFALSGKTTATFSPMEAPKTASEMPVFPELESRIVLPEESKLPLSIATEIILAAARSLTDPVGFRNSALAQYPFSFSFKSGVLPTEFRRELSCPEEKASDRSILDSATGKTISFEREIKSSPALITYRDVIPEDYSSLSANFSSYIDELDENPNLGLVLRKEKPTPAEELRWFSGFYDGFEKGNVVATAAVEENAGAVGLCDVGRTFPGSYSSHRGELGITVRKEYRGKGVGTELLRQTIEKCRGKFEVIELRVFSINPARKLYEKFGFRTYGHDPFGVYRSGRYFEEDLMYLKL